MISSYLKRAPYQFPTRSRITDSRRGPDYVPGNRRFSRRPEIGRSVGGATPPVGAIGQFSDSAPAGNPLRNARRRPPAGQRRCATETVRGRDGSRQTVRDRPPPPVATAGGTAQFADPHRSRQRRRKTRAPCRLPPAATSFRYPLSPALGASAHGRAALPPPPSGPAGRRCQNPLLPPAATSFRPLLAPTRTAGQPANAEHGTAGGRPGCP